MTGLALILALAIGQAAPSDRAVRIRTEGVEWNQEEQKWVPFTAHGSGTILASNDQGGELVLTARHVLENARRVRVEFAGMSYAVTKSHRSKRADLAAVEADLPGTWVDCQLSATPGRQAEIFGFGAKGGLHKHPMDFLRSNPGWHEYTPGGNEGDSGAGVFDQNGQLFGVFVAKDQRNSNAVVVSSYELCQFVGNPNAASGNKSTFIFPFFWKRVAWGGANSGSLSVGNCPPGYTCQPISQQPIIQSPIVQPVPVVQSPIVQPAPVVASPGVGVVVSAPGTLVHVGTPAPAVPQGTPDATPPQAGGAAPPTAAGLAPVTPTAAPAVVDYNAIVQAVVTALKNDPSMRGPAGANGVNGVNGKDGAAAAVTPSQLPILRMNAKNAAGVVVSTKDYSPTTDPATGKLIYDVTMNPATTLTTQPAQ